MNGFGTSSSDLDISLLFKVPYIIPPVINFKDDNPRHIREYIPALKRFLPEHLFSNIEIVDAARVPVIKFTAPIGNFVEGSTAPGLQIDMSFNNALAVANSKY